MARSFESEQRLLDRSSRYELKDIRDLKAHRTARSFGNEQRAARSSPCERSKTPQTSKRTPLPHRWGASCSIFALRAQRHQRPQSALHCQILGAGLLDLRPASSDTSETSEHSELPDPLMGRELFDLRPASAETSERTELPDPSRASG